METIRKEDQAKISKLVKVADKVERLALKPKPGWMAVQRDRHDRFYFDGERWRLWRPGTKKHWRNCGRPEEGVGRLGDEGNGRLGDGGIGRLGDLAKVAAYIIVGIIVVLAIFSLLPK